jgi:hypothetical protein
MNNNSNTPKPRLVHNQAIYSLILGLISTILPIIVIEIYGVHGRGSGPYREYPWCIVMTGICVILGLFFGIRGLKSTKKLAIIGIIVCSISLVFWIMFFVNWLYFILF